MIKDKYLDIEKFVTDKKIFRLFRAVENHGGVLRFVGGAVRNALRGIEGSDLDLATDLSPDELVEACQESGLKTVPIGIKFGTVGVVVNGKVLEVTSLRKDVKTDGRHGEVEFTTDWEIDASRRDLTINAVYADEKGNVFDYYNGIARITINRERYRNAFTPTTTGEMSDAMRICREEPDINVVVLTGAGDKAFCSGGDQNVKGRGGYIGKDGVPRLSVLDVQKQIRSIPKPVIAAVNGFAIGGGHVLHVVCDLSIASENAIFGQTGPRVGSFDAGFGSSYLARVVGQKKAREIWFLCRKYNAQEALDMGLVNKVVPLDKLEDEYVQWAEEIMQLSPLALRMIKAGLNAELDGQAGIQELAGDATLLYYLTDEAQEGKNAFLEKRKPNFKQYPKFP